MVSHITFAFRTLRKSPGYTLLAVGALALGIGVNAVLFSAINTLFLRPLGYPQSEQLVRVFGSFPQKGLERLGISWPRYELLRQQQQSFSSLAAQAFTAFTLTSGGEPERVQARRVTANFFPTLGVSPMLGRNFSPAEERPGGSDVALLSHAYWQTRFGGRADLVGQSIILDGRPYTVIGIMPALAFPFDQVRVWASRPLEDETLSPDLIQRGVSYLNVIGRLKPGVSLAQAQLELNVVLERYGRAYPEKVDAQSGLAAIPLQEDLVGASRPMFLTLLGAVGLVLLVACANVANLLLARFAARRKEIAIRIALGASRARIVGQFLTESVLTATAAGALGLLVAVWGLDLLARMGANFIPRVHELQLDHRVLGFSVALALVTGLAVGFFPALQASRADAGETLKDSARGSTAGRSAGALRATLLVTEVALSLVVLVSAALLIESFRRLQRVDPGFRAEGVATFFVGLSTGQYPTTERQALFIDQALEKIRALPGVIAASASDELPVVGPAPRSPAVIEGHVLPPMAQRPEVRRATTSPGFFRLIGVRLKQGRDFTVRDREDAPLVVLVNDAFVRHFFAPGENPIGRRLITGIQSIPREIVGVVGDFRGDTLTDPPEPQMFYPSAQINSPYQNIVVRTDRAVGGLRSEIVAAVHAVDPGMPIADVETFSEQLSQAIADRRVMMALLGAFAALALGLVGLGVYSVIAYSVAQRTNEFGIRLALGAAPRDVMTMVVREGLWLASIGLALGLTISVILAAAATQLETNLLFEISGDDPVVLGGVALFLCLVTVLACLLPALRATKVDPMIALRSE